MQLVNIKRKIMSFAVANAVLASILVINIPVSAAHNVTQNITITNQSNILDEDQIHTICNTVEKNIEENYAGVYTFDHYDITIHNETNNGDTTYVDVDVLVDMTLVRNPQDSPYVIGMKTALDEITNADDKKIALQEYNAYLQMVMPYYNMPELTGFLYRVCIPTEKSLDADDDFDFKLYHRSDMENEEVILSEVLENEQYTEIADSKDGEDYIKEKLCSVNSETRSVSFNASKAVKYAVAHATDEPEYSKENGNGSDCANFVSKCINAGGIPQDNSGKWYPGSLHWIRTGYNKENGVTIYMKKKGYFSAVTSTDDVTLGSIMSYNNKSHVAIVTRFDGSTIKYSHHSDVAKAAVYYTYTSRTDDVTFYVPQV